ncbi:heterokaryon incompatibility protein-domain-containing protein [Tricladium varicosporioides]|nr:heterokaryon incompatibility protein-domain-containing protein [Hymenoscyphus varicosporioides]
MDEELDKALNRKTHFKYPAIEATRHTRLLRASYDRLHRIVSYRLEVVPLEYLRWTSYRALSYTWGHAYSGDIIEIQIDGQPFFIRRNLFDFLAAAATRGKYGLFFIDAICINQLDHDERQSQVQEMTQIYRNANEVIAWLGQPEIGQVDNVRALSQTIGSFHSDRATWTASQCAGFRYLSYHGFWSRIWIVQEVLLASSMEVWCGSFTFPIKLFGSTSGTLPPPKTKLASNGRPSTVVCPSSRLQSPAEIIVTHRLRHVPRPLKDPLAQGTKIGTIEEITAGLESPSEAVVNYQTQIQDLLYQVMRKFGKLECSDPRDRLYGLMGILNKRSRARVEPNYRRDVSYAYYQALKIGLQELSAEGNIVSLPDHRLDADCSYLAYYCEVRDAFRMEDGLSLSILRRVLDELHLYTRLQDAFFQVQWQQQFMWHDAEINISPGFKQLLMHAEQENPKADGLLFKFHTRQRIAIESLLSWLQSCSRRHKGWRQFKESSA